MLPAAVPKGRRLWISAVLLDCSVIGLFVSLLSRSRITWIFALTVIAGFAAFLSQVVWMTRRPRRRPPCNAGRILRHAFQTPSRPPATPP